MRLGGGVDVPTRVNLKEDLLGNGWKGKLRLKPVNVDTKGPKYPRCGWQNTRLGSYRDLPSGTSCKALAGRLTKSCNGD